jgi:hypothetical protein
MKVISLFALAGSAAAFAPSQQDRASTAVSAFENEVGVQAPVSDNELCYTFVFNKNVDLSFILFSFS